MTRHLSASCGKCGTEVAFVEEPYFDEQLTGGKLQCKCGGKFGRTRMKELEAVRIQLDKVAAGAVHVGKAADFQRNRWVVCAACDEECVSDDCELVRIRNEEGYVCFGCLGKEEENDDGQRDCSTGEGRAANDGNPGLAVSRGPQEHRRRLQDGAGHRKVRAVRG